MSTAPIRHSRRTKVSAIARIVEPGHPGSAAYQVIDLSNGGLFVADEQNSLGPDTMIRVGLPNSHRPHERVWAWGNIAWSGSKYGKQGVGITLSFDAPDGQLAWINAVANERRTARLRR